MGPQAVTELTGVPVAVLSERTVTQEQLTRATVRGLIQGHPSPEIDGLSVEEVVEVAIVQLEEGFFDGARQLSEKALRKVPRHRDLQMLRAFCFLPVEPSGSRRVWLELLENGEVNGDHADILRVDVAASFLMEGRNDLAMAEVVKIDDGKVPVSAWLWDPSSLPHSPRVAHAAIDEWIAKFETAITR